MNAPLQGLKVLDLSRVLAGPWCAQILGDLGADVVKVELPGRGDDSRQFGPALSDAEDLHGRDSTFFMACNRNKRSIAVDLSHPDGAALVRQLARQTDVLVENFKAGGLRKYGLDADSLQADNPRLIYCSVTGFGHDGPYAPRPAYDFVMQALSGLMSTCGQPDDSPGGMPTRTAVPQTDLVTGYSAAVAVLAAVIQRAQTGKGQFIDAAMLDASVSFNVHLALGYLLTGQPPQRQGNANPIAAPSEVFGTADGWMVIAAGNDGQFHQLCAALGLPALAQDPRFSSNKLRVAQRAVLHDLLEPILQTRPTTAWLEALEARQVPCAPIYNMDQVFADPQVQHRQLVAEVEHGSGQRVTLMRSTLNLADTIVPLKPPPQLGAHTTEVLREWLDMPAHDIAALHHQRAIEGRG